MATITQCDDAAIELVQLLQRLITAPDLAYLSEAAAEVAVSKLQEFCNNAELHPAGLRDVMQARVMCLQLHQAPAALSATFCSCMLR
jgi:hypothetical protein